MMAVPLAAQEAPANRLLQPNWEQPRRARRQNPRRPKPRRRPPPNRRRNRRPVRPGKSGFPATSRSDIVCAATSAATSTPTERGGPRRRAQAARARSQLPGSQAARIRPHRRQGNNWGGDPYNTARLDARKEGVYRFSADYRNQAYFNFLPSFANPLVDRGVLLNERSFDIHRRFANVELELRPGKRIVPFLTYSHDAGYGRGITTFVSNSNEYPGAERSPRQHEPVQRRAASRTEPVPHHPRAGRNDFQRRSAGLHDRAEPGQPDDSFLWRTAFSRDPAASLWRARRQHLQQGYLTANPVSWLDVYGQFLYSQPRTDVSYSQLNTGNFALGPARSTAASSIF